MANESRIARSSLSNARPYVCAVCLSVPMIEGPRTRPRGQTDDPAGEVDRGFKPNKSLS